MIHGLHTILAHFPESAEDLVHDLEHTNQSPRPWGAVFSCIVAFFSLGALPVLLWHDRFREFAEAERRLFNRFVDWVRKTSDRPETFFLRSGDDALKTRPLLSLMLLGCVVGVIAMFGLQLSNAGNDRPVIDQLLLWTYRFQPLRHWHPPASSAQRIHMLWMVGISLAYIIHFLQVQAHVSDVRQMAKQVNCLLGSSASNSLPQLKGLEIRFLWIIGSLLFAARGVWWGIPLALCGAAQQQYMRTESARIRRSLAARIRTIAGFPAVPDKNTVARRCAQARCLAMLPPGARFCPRCGHDSDNGVTYVPSPTNSV